MVSGNDVKLAYFARYCHLGLNALESDKSSNSSAITRLQQRLLSREIAFVDELGHESTIVKTGWKDTLGTLKKIRNAVLCCNEVCNGRNGFGVFTTCQAFLVRTFTRL
jgi:hypothetical protein